MELFTNNVSGAKELFPGGLLMGTFSQDCPDLLVRTLVLHDAVFVVLNKGKYNPPPQILHVNNVPVSEPRLGSKNTF